MRARAFHVIPVGLASLYAIWCLLIIFCGGDWGPLFLYYPLWPFGIGLELLIQSVPHKLSESAQWWLVSGIWLLGGIIWYLLLGYLLPWSACRLGRFFRRRIAT